VRREVLAVLGDQRQQLRLDQLDLQLELHPGDVLPVQRRQVVERDLHGDGFGVHDQDVDPTAEGPAGKQQVPWLFQLQALARG
jgi:hypothetical protein